MLLSAKNASVLWLIGSWLIDWFCCSMFAYPVPSIEFGPKSLTVVAGDNVTLSCGTLPNNDSQLTINWQRNGQSIPLSRHRQTLLHIPDNGSISSLHLDHVSELDEGVYQCTARNELGLDVSRPARLSVQCKWLVIGGRWLMIWIYVQFMIASWRQNHGRTTIRVQCYERHKCSNRMQCPRTTSSKDWIVQRWWFSTGKWWIDLQLTLIATTNRYIR